MTVDFELQKVEGALEHTVTADKEGAMMQTTSACTEEDESQQQ
jgi:hypothetical protein